MGTVERMRTTPGRRALPIAVDVTLVRRHLTTYTGAQGSGFPSNCAEILEISWIFFTCLLYSPSGASLVYSPSSSSRRLLRSTLFPIPISLLSTQLRSPRTLLPRFRWTPTAPQSVLAPPSTGQQSLTFFPVATMLPSWIPFSLV